MKLKFYVFAVLVIAVLFSVCACATTSAAPDTLEFLEIADIYTGAQMAELFGEAGDISEEGNISYHFYRNVVIGSAMRPMTMAKMSSL